MKEENDLINRIEAVLFSSGKKTSIADLKRICKTRDEENIRNAVSDLKKRHDDSTSLMIVDEKDSWKMTIREKYNQFIKKIVTDTELPKTIMETLAVVAWRSPVRQSEVIKIRTNKAYDHLKELEESGFITSQKSGRTKLLKLTPKFYEYFDLEGDEDIRKAFKKFREKEENLKKEAEKEIEEEKLQEEKEKQGEDVEVYEQNKPDVEVYEKEENKMNPDVEVFEEEQKTEVIESEEGPEKKDENDEKQENGTDNEVMVYNKNPEVETYSDETEKEEETK